MDNDQKWILLELYKDIVYRLPLGKSKKFFYIIFVYYSGAITLDILLSEKCEMK